MASPSSAKKIGIKKPLPRSDANNPGTISFELNSKKKADTVTSPVEFDSSKIESAFLDANVMERRIARASKQQTALSKT